MSSTTADGSAPLLVVGAGGHGKVVADAALATGRWRTVVFVDDRHPGLTEVLGFPVVGPLAALPALRGAHPEAIVAIGAGAARLVVLAQLAELETALLAVAGLATQAPPTSVRTGALVTTEDDDGHAARYWVCPAGGGLELAGAIKVITPSAPLGRALLGHKAGDELELVVGGKRRTLTIVAIA